MDNAQYTTVCGDSEFSLSVKRSEFIASLSHVVTKEDAEGFINKIKQKNRDARHNVYAYLLRDGTLKYSDDGEPGGTAGLPVLSVIQKSGICDCVIVVTRYFGGVLLGGGGLLRAYSESASGAIELAEKRTLRRYTRIDVSVSYSQQKTVQKLCEDYGAVIDKAEYSDKVMLSVLIVCGDCDRFMRSACDATGGSWNGVCTDAGYR